MTLDRYAIRDYKYIGHAILNGDGTTTQALITGAAHGSVVFLLLARSNAAAAHVVNVALNNGAVVPLASVSVPAGSGYAGVPPVDLLAGLPSILSQGIPIGPGDDLELALEVAVDGEEELLVGGVGGDA